MAATLNVVVVCTLTFTANSVTGGADHTDLVN